MRIDPQAVRAVEELEWGAMREDPVFFARRIGWEPDTTQARVLRCRASRIALLCSRQWGKSTTIAMLALHRSLFFPGSLVLMVAPSERQSKELFAKFKRFAQRCQWLPRVKIDNSLEWELENGSRIVALPDREGTVRAFSAVDLLISDEDALVQDALYRAVRPMLAMSRGRMVLMTTPRGERGHFWEAWTGQHDRFARFRVRASECPRYDRDFLAAERRALGELWYLQEYECHFVASVADLFSPTLIRSAFVDDVEELEGLIVHSTDALDASIADLFGGLAQ